MALPQGSGRTDEEWRQMIREAYERLKAMPPEEQAKHWEAQRMSWVRGEMMLRHPDMTEAAFADIWEKIIK